MRRGLWRVRGLPTDRAGLTGDVGEPGTPSSALASGFAALATRAIEIAVPPALRNAAAPRAPGVRGDCAGLPGLLGPSLAPSLSWIALIFCSTLCSSTSITKPLSEPGSSFVHMKLGCLPGHDSPPKMTLHFLQ